MNRYERHIPLYSKEEFIRIRKAKIAVAGSGGLGSTVLQLLARIGFGTIHFWDDAVLDAPDLNRQILYKTTDIGKTKTTAALAELKEINPEIKYFAHQEKLNALTKIPDVDLVIDCLDTFSSRLILDQLFFANNIPIIHGSVFKHMGQVTTLFPTKTENYQYTFGIDNKSEEQQEKTVFPPIVTTIASLQVSEAVKCINKSFNQMLLNKLLIINLKENKFETIPLI
ncbi:MAG: HesA/MoeB/ThiF family protein [Bacteroidetes bacterium]|nr:MAG: HesA/MoeB/ThiF family protein [Bacteroidota bacterium]